MKKQLYKICQLCDVKTGKLDANASSENGVYPFFTCSKDPLRINSYSYDAECVLIAGNGDLNVKYYNGKFDAYQRTYIVTLKKNIKNITVHYLYTFFSLYIDILRQKSIGGVIKYIKLGDITEALIPVPPIEEQQRIVTELDLLSSIIEKQKAQLKELDTLAQSIFYDMFGDPVTNEKGWEIKSIMNIGYVERGKGISKKDFVENGVPCIHYGQLHTTFSAFTTKHVSCIPENLLKKPSIAHKGDLVMAITSEDVECSCKSTAWMGDYDIIVGSDAAILHHNQNGIYLSYCTKTESFFNEKSKYAKGFKVTHISTAEIEQIPILIPPLPLQQQFADKIQSIESQKSAITKSIAETQKLFDYTMDNYFG
ncbi:MAG: restriction endonuclease subunit S [bacterium]|nr:restriction endonuclease subunit S [Candidatus Colousia faecequi]